MSLPDDRFAGCLGAYLAGDLDAEERAAFEAAVLADPELTDRLAEAVRLDAAVREVLVTRGGATAADAVRRGRVWLVAVPMAAAALALFLLWPRDLQGPFEGRHGVMRGPGAAVTAQAPVGKVSPPVEYFQWIASPGAMSYRLELRDLDGATRHVVVVGDTLLLRAARGFPAVVDSLTAGFTWQVVPLLADGREGNPSRPVTVVPSR